MIARIDQENSIGSGNDDPSRLAGRDAYRIDAGKSAAVEVLDLVRGQFQFANCTVVCIRYQNPVAIDRDSERMLQTCLREITVDPSELEESGANQGLDLRVV